jgi:hypothetical protein
VQTELEITGELPEHVIYRFPRRNLGYGRLLVCAMLAGLFALAYLFVVVPVARMLAFQALGNVLPTAIGSCLALVILRAPLRFGLCLLFGRREIELSTDELCSTERLFFLRYTKRWPTRDIRRFQIVHLGPGTVVETWSPFLDHLNVLTGTLSDDKQVLLVPLYPQSLLNQLTENLSQQVGVETRSSTQPKNRLETAPPIGIGTIVANAARAIRNPTDPEVFEQPPGSTVEVDARPDGITLRVPPAGLWKGSAGLFKFGIIWTTFTAIMTTVFLITSIGQGMDAFGLLGFVIFMGLFWAAGGIMLLCGWSMGTRESVVAVVPESLMVMQTGLRGPKRLEWPRHEITKVCVGPSGIEVNDVALQELQIHGPKGKLFGMLAGRDERELIWMATMLRQSLKNTEPSARVETTSEVPG